MYMSEKESRVDKWEQLPFNNIKHNGYRYTRIAISQLPYPSFPQILGTLIGLLYKLPANYANQTY